MTLATRVVVLSSFGFGLGCGEVPADLNIDTAAASPKLSIDTTPDSIGKAQTVSPTPIDQSSANPFFHNFGTNGRTCGTCHTEATGWTITPVFAQSRPVSDPLFVFDGSDCLPPGVPNPNPGANSTQMLQKANVRIDIPIPAGADFTLTSFSDPIGCPTPPSASDIRMYRRPLPSANSAFLATVMWDGRENVNPPNNTVPLIQADLAHQANGATLGHAQATSPLPSATQQQIVTFETNTFNAQSQIGNLNLDQDGANGGGKFLYNTVLPNFYIGINDVLGCVVPNSCQPGKTATFSSVIFTVYQQWETAPKDAATAAIGRGEKIFNTRTFPIDNVAGINGPNDTLGLPNPLPGFCGTCHDSPNVGNHSTSLPIDIGIAAASPVGGLDVARLPKYTFTQNGTAKTITVTDPGRALITGKFADIGKFKGPNLRGLSTRAPYFHNGSAKDLNAIVEFYDDRFHIGFTAQERSDLVAFLQAL
jgi:cytochrome c peroxidase